MFEYKHRPCRRPHGHINLFCCGLTGFDRARYDLQWLGIDPERRWNCEKLLQSARPQLAQIVGSELAADQFIERLMAHYDDPMTCSYAALYFTRGRVRGLTPIDL